MFSELIVALAAYAYFFVLGYPCWLLLRQTAGDAEPGRSVSLLFAPAFGLAIVSLIIFPLYRYVGPAAFWALPLVIGTTVLAAASATWLALARMREAKGKFGRTEDLAGLAAVLVVAIVYGTMMLTLGESRLIYGANPSDALNYLAHADYSKSIPWDTIWEGRRPTEADQHPEILRASPTALMSARFLELSIRLDTQLALGAMSQISGLGVERLLFAFVLSLALVTAGAIFACARLLRVSLPLAVIAALLSVLGLWWNQIRDQDSYAQIHAIAVVGPLFALRLASAQLRAAGEVRRTLYLDIASGIALAACISTYPELAPLWIGAIGLELMVVQLAIVKKWSPQAAAGALAGCVIAGGVGLATALFALLLTGQLLYVFSFFLSQVETYSSVFEGKASLSGILPLEVPLATDSALVLAGSWPLGPNAALAAKAGLVAVVALLVMTLRRMTAERLVVLAWSAGIAGVVAYFLLLKQDGYAFVKLYGSAFWLVLLLFGIVLSASVELARNLWKGSGLQSRLMAGLVAAVALLALLPLAYNGLTVSRYFQREIEADPTRHAMRGKQFEFDFAAITNFLEEARPSRLLVYVPFPPDWPFAGLAAMSFQKFKPVYQSGYLVDNRSTGFVTPPSLDAREMPDYAVVSVLDDYVGEQGLGELQLEAGGMRVYAITSSDVAPFKYRKPPETYGMSWSVTAPDTMNTLSIDSHQLSFSGGYTQAIFGKASVRPGETLTLKMSIQGPPGATLRLMLYRHCHSPDGSEEGSQPLDLQLTGDPQKIELSHTFQRAYDCVRVSFQPIGGASMAIVASEIRLTKQK